MFFWRYAFSTHGVESPRLERVCDASVQNTGPVNAAQRTFVPALKMVSYWWSDMRRVPFVCLGQSWMSRSLDKCDWLCACTDCPRFFVIFRCTEVRRGQVKDSKQLSLFPECVAYTLIQIHWIHFITFSIIWVCESSTLLGLLHYMESNYRNKWQSDMSLHHGFAGI